MASKKGLPMGMAMRHDSHYVDDLARNNRSIGRVIAIDKIAPNPDQPRVEIGDLTELTSSIKEKGVLEPLLVRPNEDGRTFMIIAGERRWRSANAAGLTEVPCIELDIDDNAVAEIALIENLQRKDLTIWEEADGFASLAKRFGYTHDDIAKKIGKSRSTITESMAIAGLPSNIRSQCLEGSIASKSTLLELSRQFDEKSMQTLLDKIKTKGLNRDQIRETARPHAAKKEPAAEKEGKQGTSGRVFNYLSRSKGYSVEVKFNSNTSYTNEDIIEALEDTLRSLKK